eukprot:11893886-Alexandrium_andersonii.AAC.1
MAIGPDHHEPPADSSAVDCGSNCGVPLVARSREVAVEVANSHPGPGPARNVVEAGSESAFGVDRE